MFYSYHHLITLFITTFIADSGLGREPSVIFECCKLEFLFCFEDARRSRARTMSYRWAVIGTSETHHGDIKAVSFKEKTHGISTKSGNKTSSASKAESVLCQFCGKTITLTPIAVREPQSSRAINTVLMSVRKPMVG